jgi:hypothetical protein
VIADRQLSTDCAIYHGLRSAFGLALAFSRYLDCPHGESRNERRHPIGTSYKRSKQPGGMPPHHESTTPEESSEPPQIERWIQREPQSADAAVITANAITLRCMYQVHDHFRQRIKQCPAIYCKIRRRSPNLAAHS